MTHGHDDSGGIAGDAASVAKEQTVLTSLIVDVVLWIPDIAAAILSGSITMFADVLKCGDACDGRLLWSICRYRR